MGCHDDHLIPGLSDMTQAVHAEGGKIVLQIAHGGIFASAELNEQAPFGASALQTESEEIGYAMTKEDIEFTIDAFAKAANRAVQSGFDGLQIHAAHGYWESRCAMIARFSQEYRQFWLNGSGWDGLSRSVRKSTEGSRFPDHQRKSKVETEKMSWMAPGR